jgi:hypothetical protein
MKKYGLVGILCGMLVLGSGPLFCASAAANSKQDAAQKLTVAQCQALMARYQGEMAAIEASSCQTVRGKSKFVAMTDADMVRYEELTVNFNALSLQLQQHEAAVRKKQAASSK